MIRIHYCGICGDLGLVEKLKHRLSKFSNVDEDDIEEVECGSCKMRVTMSGETIYSEDREILDIDGIVETVRSNRQARA